VQATGRRIGEGWCQRRQSNEGRERGICDQIVGFVCSLANRAGPSPLFSHPESPSAPQGAGMAWARRMDEGPNPGENEQLGVRLSRFCRPKEKLRVHG
jgi:hypothetical protein